MLKPKGLLIMHTDHTNTVDYLVESCGTVLTTTKNKIEAIDVFTKASGPMVVIYRREAGRLVPIHRQLS